MSSAKKLLEAAAGNAGGASLDIADVFSTFLPPTGTGFGATVNNGIDFAGEGGLLWLKARNANGYNHTLYDTERSGTLFSDATNAASDYASDIASFNSNGYTTLASGSSYNDQAGVNYVGWSFRKAPKFFDIVTYTGNGASGRLIDHNLGSAPGMVTIKCTSTGGTNWSTYHRGLTANHYILLNTTGVQAGNGFDRTVSSTQYELGPNWADENQNGRTYVAYFFAHNNNDGEFGPDADQDIIKCGVMGTNSGVNDVYLGWQPQFIITKFAVAQVGATSNNWYMFDSMRNWGGTGISPRGLLPSGNNAEFSLNSDAINLTGQGFTFNPGRFNNPSTYIYMAIRAPMITPPEAATEVFSMQATGGSGLPKYTASHDVDMALMKATGSSEDWFLSNRLTPEKYLIPNENVVEASNANFSFDYNNGWYEATTSRQSWMWKRAKGYFDVVTYSGTGQIQGVLHSLGVAPEMFWVKRRDSASTSNWIVYHKDLGPTKYIRLNDYQTPIVSSAMWANSDPSATGIVVSNATEVNNASGTYISYLFATLPGISKVGSVSHSGSSTDVDCGFSAGARFILLKRIDGNSNWLTWDSVRGIVAGNDPYLVLNSNAVQVTNTDYIDPLSSGFTITGNFTDGDYIFYAIA